MIYAVLTTKPSLRLPGKNPLLLPYTLAWLQYASLWCHEPLVIISVGEYKCPNLPPKIPHIWVVDGMGHYEKLRTAMAAYPEASDDDVCVLPQLTQPCRSKYLLARAVCHCRQSHRTVVTASVMPSQSWRYLDTQGRWRKARDGSNLVYDGYLYAWQGAKGLVDVFDPDAPHEVVHTYHRWGLIDIDSPGDIPPALGAIWAETLL